MGRTRRPFPPAPPTRPCNASNGRRTARACRSHAGKGGSSWRGPAREVQHHSMGGTRPRSCSDPRPCSAPQGKARTRRGRHDGSPCRGKRRSRPRRPRGSSRWGRARTRGRRRAARPDRRTGRKAQRRRPWGRRSSPCKCKSSKARAPDRSERRKRRQGAAASNGRRRTCCRSFCRWPPQPRRRKGRNPTGGRSRDTGARRPSAPRPGRRPSASRSGS
mmetsp:Transcript_49805/g.143324  ORF Transcript_49805/g.143324 Transcript_49805/m.143324 type:complete len:218 (-) Transcript_49805:408-1061(-)